MYSKDGIKNNQGISKILIIIIILVILLIIGAVAFIFLNNNSNNEQQQPEQENLNTMGALQDTDTTITLEEKNYIKYNYLDKVSILVSNMYSTQQENIVETAMRFVQDPNTDSTETVTGSQNTVVNTNNVIGNTDLNNSITNGNTTNNISNNTNSLANNTNTNSNTIIINENNTNSLNNVGNTNITGGNTIDSSLNGGMTSLDLNTQANANAQIENVQKAISEITNESVENVGTLMSQLNSSNSILKAYVTDIISISKENGVYNVTYKVCWPIEDNMKYYKTMDKMNTAAVDRLESTTVNITFTKNMDYEYSRYKLQSIAEVEKTTPVCYYLTYVNNKFGVIDEKGNVVIDNTYDWIDIPNNYKDIFICKTGETTTVLNKDNQQLYTEYPNISVIQSSQGGNSLWYEKDFLVFEENGKYGAIDYDGFVVYEPVYDKIEPLYYIEGRLILTENGKQALGDITGKIISNFKYTKIGLLGGQFEISSMVNSQRTQEQVVQMMETGDYILGQDVDNVIETIQIIPVGDVAGDFANLPQINYNASINEWQLRSLDNKYLLYIR